MDQKTIDNLVGAYQAAPSSELAKVICLAYIAIEEPLKASDFFENLPQQLDQVELTTILEAASQLDEITKLKLICEKYLRLTNEIFQTSENNELKQSISEFINIEDDKPKLKLVEKSNIAELTSLNRYREHTTTFTDVVGLEKIKKQIHKKIILPFQKPSLFQKFKKKVGGGVLLYGPPGCGKTLLARATAGECKASFFNIEISDVLDMYIGESEQKLHAIFEKARAETPSVVFFDELEALAGKREHSRNSNTSNLVSQFLTELDGFTQNNEGVLVLASTNVPWSVDNAFLRPGRFDRMFFVPPPDKAARASILEHHMKDRPKEHNIDFSVIANTTGGYSGADLANLVEMAADEAIDESIESAHEVKISSQHFKEALSESRATTLEWLTTARNYARYANDGGRYNDVLDFLKKHGK